MTLAECATFVLCTIRCPLPRAVEDFQTILEPDASDSALKGVLYGSKARGHAEIWSGKENLYRMSEAIWLGADDENAAACELVSLWSSIYGLGYVKAGFVVQLAYGVSGCLDTHNVKRFGLPARARVLRGGEDIELKPATKRQHIKEYHGYVERCGGTARLWDTWCAFVATNQPGRYSTADDASALHAQAFGLLN